MAHDEHGAYRGVYQWDGAEAAQTYARALWRVLELVSEPGSIHYRVLPGIWRDDLLGWQPDEQALPDAAAWWRPVAVTPVGVRPGVRRRARLPRGQAPALTYDSTLIS
jgi:hypothetical protein